MEKIMKIDQEAEKRAEENTRKWLEREKEHKVEWRRSMNIVCCLFFHHSYLR